MSRHQAAHRQMSQLPIKEGLTNGFVQGRMLVARERDLHFGYGGLLRAAGRTQRLCSPARTTSTSNDVAGDRTRDSG
jgi:hypothetical protein